MKRLEKPNWQKKQEKQKKMRIIVLCAVLLVTLLVGAGVFWKNFAPDWINSASEANNEYKGNTIFVKAGGDFQAALNRAKAGDTIILQAGAKFVGAFTLPNKAGSEFITIQSSELAKLPKDGVRVSPNDAALMPKILSLGKGESAIKTASSAHHYRFAGIEFAPNNADYIYNLVALGTDDQQETEIPHHIEFDHCYLHPNANGKTRRGVALNSAETVIKNSYIAGFAYREEETQAIAGWNGSGKYKIINNYLEAGAENVLFGGADPSIKNLVPTDIEIRNNFITKPLDWRGKVTIKCGLELKNARNVQITGNIIENSFDEMAIRFTVRNQGGKSPWSTIEDVVMENNIVRNSGGGINFLGTDDTYPSQKMKRVRVVNNLFTDINVGSDQRFILIADGEEISVENNTVFNGGNAITAHGAPTKRFSFRGNIVSYNNYGFSGDNGVGKVVFPKYFSDGVVVENLIINSKGIPKDEIYIPPRNFFAEDFSKVGFMNLQGGNYRLAANSKFKNKSVNGKDVGANIDAIEAETSKAK
ncbi:hypothetical protein BH10ACI1_BH10ACI1_16410 [soil metagenome]